DLFILYVKGRIFFRPRERFKTFRFLAAVPVQHKIPRYRKEPSFEFPLAVVLRATLEDADPGFLETIFGTFTAAGQMKQIAEQPELILLDEQVEQLRVAVFQAASDGLRVIGHQAGVAGPRRKGNRSDHGTCRGKGRAHSTGDTIPASKKTHARNVPLRPVLLYTYGHALLPKLRCRVSRRLFVVFGLPCAVGSRQAVRARFLARVCP